MSGGFSVDWTTRSVPVFEKYLVPFVGGPVVRGLEIGVLEGRMTCWLMENVLTHPARLLYCIDGFGGLYGVPELDNDNGMMNAERRWRENTEPYRARIKLVRHDTPVAFQSPIWGEVGEIDFAYIDGCHRADVVLSDLVHVVPKLSRSGVIILDDYYWTDSPPELYNHVYMAMDAWWRCQMLAGMSWDMDIMGTCAILRRTQEPS